LDITTLFEGISFVTTAPAHIITLSPTVTPGIIMELTPI
jgi:hypothetical protein